MFDNRFIFDKNELNKIKKELKEKGVDIDKCNVQSNDSFNDLHIECLKQIDEGLEYINNKFYINIEVENVLSYGISGLIMKPSERNELKKKIQNEKLKNQVSVKKVIEEYLLNNIKLQLYLSVIEDSKKAITQIEAIKRYEKFTNNPINLNTQNIYTKIKKIKEKDLKEFNKYFFCKNYKINKKEPNVIKIKSNILIYSAINFKKSILDKEFVDKIINHQLKKHKSLYKEAIKFKEKFIYSQENQYKEKQRYNIRIEDIYYFERFYNIVYISKVTNKIKKMDIIDKDFIDKNKLDARKLSEKFMYLPNVFENYKLFNMIYKIHKQEFSFKTKDFEDLQYKLQNLIIPIYNNIFLCLLYKQCNFDLKKMINKIKKLKFNTIINRYINSSNKNNEKIFEEIFKICSYEHKKEKVYINKY